MRRQTMKLIYAHPRKASESTMKGIEFAFFFTSWLSSTGAKKEAKHNEKKSEIKHNMWKFHIHDHLGKITALDQHSLEVKIKWKLAKLTPNLSLITAKSYARPDVIRNYK